MLTTLIGLYANPAVLHSQRELFPKFRNKFKFGRWEEIVVQLLLAVDVNYVAPH